MLEVLESRTLTALATALGVIPVWALGADAERWRPALTGFAGGAMGVAAIVGLLGPALDRGSLAEVACGFLAGVAFLLATRLALGTRHGLGRDQRSAMLIFGALSSTASRRGSQSGPHTHRRKPVWACSWWWRSRFRTFLRAPV